MTDRKLRVVQWATGTVGMCALRAIIGHPQLELVGVGVYSEAKDGLDAGDLCGLPATGVTASRDLLALLTLKPDCVVYMPQSTDIDDVCRILASGANIVTTRAEFFNPAHMPQEQRERVQAACNTGQTTIHSTGSSPGFITEVLPIALLSLQRRLDLLTIEEFADCIDGCSEDMLRSIMGFGEDPQTFAARQYPDRDVVFAASLAALGDAIGLPIDGFESHDEVAVTRTETLLHTTKIAAGTVGGQRHSVTALHKGKPVLRFISNWYVTRDLAPAWDLREDGWLVRVEGDTPLDISVRFPIPDNAGQRQMILPGLTAHRPVNAVPAVCAAAPGIATTATLPQVIARLG